MNVIENWYWQYGIQRGNDPTDPDCALRKITVGDWLDPVSHALDKIEALKKSRDGKSTIALWGPSQTGKSTLLSQYLDGMMADGSDSALTWDANAPVRFSPDRTLGAETERVYPNTLVFNPFNHGSDASGVATRYTLANDGDPNVDVDHPIEYRLGGRQEVLHAMTLGYDAECERTGGGDDLRQDEFLAMLKEGDGETQAQPLEKASRWLRDAADVIERSRTATDRFKGLFRRGEWMGKVRPALVSAPHLLASEEAAKSFVFGLLWDGTPRLTDFFTQIEGMRASIEREWAGAKRILMSPAVAALLLDIGTLERWFGGTENYQTPDPAIVDKLNRIAWQKKDNGDIVIDIGGSSSNSFISGAAFGLFQALCSEIVVPVKRSVLESGGEAKAPMLALLEKHDLLDFPGLGRRHLGGNGLEVEETRFNPVDLTDFAFYKNVLKDGRTKSAVYGHIDRYAIDAFVVLNHTQDVHPPKAKLLENGICTWLRSFDDSWRMGNPAPMPVFVNLTFFGIAVNTVQIAGANQAFAVHASELIGEMGFANCKTSKWFLSTYPQFPIGEISAAALASKSSVIDNITGCRPFMDAAGLIREDIEAVFDNDGGTGRMLRGVAAAVRPEERRARCADLLRKEIAALKEKLWRQLPTVEETGLDARRQSLRESAAAIRAVLDRINNREGNLDHMTLAEFLRDMFAAPRDAFDPLPQNAATIGRRLDDWLKAQVLRWFNDAERRVSENEILDATHQRELLCTLRDTVRIEGENGSLREFVRLNLGRIADRGTANDARTSFAVAFGNMLRFGTWRRDSCLQPGESDGDYMKALINGAIEESPAQEVSPYFKTVIEPILARIDILAETARAGLRPPQPGDNELRAILDGLDATRN